MKKIISIYIQKNPIFIGAFVVASTLLLGVAIAFATGANIPTPAYAQVAPPPLTTWWPSTPVQATIYTEPGEPSGGVFFPNIIPTCTISASDSSLPYGGGNTVLTWMISTATASASINHNIGPIIVRGGSKQIHVSVTGVYVLSLIGFHGHRNTCSTKIVVAPPLPPPTPAPTCTLSASPSAIQTGNSSTLTYTTSNAFSFKINHSVGTLTPTSGGSTHVSPTVTTTYTGTAEGEGGTVTCGAKVTVTTTPPPPPTTTCTLSAAPSSIPQGGSSILSWKTTHASSFSIDNGIGNISSIASGATTTAPTVTTTYTGTAKGANGTAVCKATVTVTHGGGGGSSMCVLIVSPSTIPSGATAKLSWGGRGIKNIFIDNGVGTTTSTSGSSSVSPSVGTHKYTGTFTTSGGQKLKCSSTLTVTGGGGPLPPMVTLTSFRKSPPSNPLALVYLSQIPYTGLDLGTVGTILYWLILIAWSGAVAYVLLFVIVPLLKRRAQTFGTQVRTVINTQEAQQSRPQPSLRVEAPALSPDAVEERSPYPSYNGFRSFAQSGALSVEDIVHGLSRNGQGHVESDTAVEPAATQPVVSDTSMSSIISSISSTQTQTMTRAKDTQEETVVKLPPAKEEQSAPVGNADTVSVASTRGFLASLLEGDRTAVFYALRQVARGGGDVTRFLTDATCMLDDAFRARVDGTDCDSGVARLVAKYQTPVLEEIITALATAIDASYSSDITAAKLALTRALVSIGA